MRKVFLLMFLASTLLAQKTPDISKSTIKQDIYFLASDELQGRKTGEPGNLIAARYIAEKFRKFGLSNPDGIDDYYQEIPFVKRIPASSGFIQTTDTILKHGDQMIILAGDEVEMEVELVFVEQAWVDDEVDHFSGIDIRGKVAVSLYGKPGSQDPREGFSAIQKKRKNVKVRGGIGLIEIYEGAFPWAMIKAYLNQPQLTVNDNPGDINKDLFILSDYNFTPQISELRKGKRVHIKITNSGVLSSELYSPNVVGYIEGSDPQLRDEYVIVSAHYDHIGTLEDGEGDRIFNGARDNAIGVGALLSTAEYLSVNPPKRSVLFLAFTGEEIGLIGSSYYVEHPVLPLKNAIFNINSDGAGYNDKSVVTIIGYDRVGVLDILNSVAARQDLEVIGDPAPEQNLFDRSDNVNFARIGIPAPTFSPGFTAFDEEINKNYHKVTDNPETLDYNYLYKFVNVFAEATMRIANLDERPQWKKGDKYEAAFKKLIGEK